MTDKPRPQARRSTAPTRRVAEEPRDTPAGGVETQRRPAPDTGDAQRHDGPEETHNERVSTPIGADEHPERAAASAHAVDAHMHGGHGAPDGDAHATGEHAAEEHALGPFDVRAWGAGAIGMAVGLLVAYMFYLGIT